MEALETTAVTEDFFARVGGPHVFTGMFDVLPDVYLLQKSWAKPA